MAGSGGHQRAGAAHSPASAASPEAPTLPVRKILLAAAAIVALVVLAVRVPSSGRPEAYPDAGREIRHVIPWRAGGGTDTAMRGFMRWFEEEAGVQVITENVPGGLSSVGLTVVQNAPPDGYTLGTMTYDALTVRLLGLAPVDWRALEPVCMVTEHPSALIVPADRWRDLAAFQADARANPATIAVGNVGQKGVWHQHAAAMEQALDIRLRHIPYEGGSGPQIGAILGSEVDAIVSSLPGAISYVRGGELRVIALMAPERSSLVPDAPTFRELGHDLEYGSFRMLVAPPGTPDDRLVVLERACRTAAASPGFTEWARAGAVGAAWRGRAAAQEYLDELAPRVEGLLAALEGA